MADEEGGPIVYLDGEELEDGETKVIADETHPNLFYLRDGHFFGDAPAFGYAIPGPDGEGQHFWLEDNEAERKTFKELMEQHRQERERIQEEMRKAREQLRQERTEERERILNDLKAQQDKIRQQTEEAMEQYREQMRQNRDEIRMRFDDRNFYLGQEGNYMFFSPGNMEIKGDTQSALEKQLLADGLIETAAAYRFELSGKGYLKVNGKKQPQDAYEKYKKLWQRTTGATVDEDTHIRINKRSQAR